MIDLGDLYAALSGELAKAEAEAAETEAVRIASLKRTPQEKRASRRGRNQRYQKKLEDEKNSMIAVLDMETDPFDSERQDRIHPFAACLASDHFDPIEIWDENHESFICKVVEAIESLPGKFTIYAHNGGKFDYLFLVHKLRGAVSFKGRGIMAAKIGPHEIRDSFHILPEKLAAYRKDEFDYQKMRKGVRNKHKKEIQKYLVNDCLYLLDFVKAFIAENGLKLSIGQAAIAAVKDTGLEVENINEHMDTFLRSFYFGGRVECLAGIGEFVGPYKLYDVNSMYPFAMANYLHPVGREYIVRRGVPGPHTVFLSLDCTNAGAFVARGEDGGTTALIERGKFNTTIWEYEVARKHNLISDVKIHFVVDCMNRQDFSDFVVPKYEQRQVYKAAMKEIMASGAGETEEYLDTKIRDILTKFYLNNAYGKYAQNPRKYRESFVTNYGERPDVPGEWGPLPVFDNEDMNYAIWEKPVERLRFKNVGTSASICGASRAILLDAICSSVDPIYCDTDSIICRDLVGVELHPTTLGAWDVEDTFSAVRIAGKKLYACQRDAASPNVKKGPHKKAAKGVEAPTWEEYGAMIDGAILETVSKGPTLTRRGTQTYVSRMIRATAKQPNHALRSKVEKIA